MGSPFPGMDPYLEGEFWQEFHETLAGQIRAQLMPRLSPKYVALLAKRYVIDRSTLGLFGVPERVFWPDVHVIERGPDRAEEGGVVTETISPPEVEIPSGLVLLFGSPLGVGPRTNDQGPSARRWSFVLGRWSEPDTDFRDAVLEVPQISIEIRDFAERRLVTVIEILSPANKVGDGAYEYLMRRADLLRTWTNLLEIDLLRGGERITLRGSVPPASYYVYLTRALYRARTAVWAIKLADRLPTVPVPLLQPDPDVPLNLQAAVDSCFALVGYERLLNYQGGLPPPELTPAEREWIEGRLVRK